MEEFFEYAVRTERPGRRPHVVEFSRFHGDAEAYRRHEAAQWGDERVHLLTRLVRRTPWQQAPNVPAVPVAVVAGG
ncbi:N-acyl-L-homoserine lactone synthetase [Streptacidiphilus sp. BW17]|jgi:hypothetical protein|uniref:hypothetical protein n=1 Tax=Streptacidiphilus sp. BW17 TaxID=3156274 RepID=UPI00351955EE